MAKMFSVLIVRPLSTAAVVAASLI